MFLQIKYLKFGADLFVDDLKNEENNIVINKTLIISLEPSIKLNAPLSNKFIGTCSCLKMANGDSYFLSHKEGIRVFEILL